jgi:hypothetical protein
MSASAGSSGHNDANGLPPLSADFVAKVLLDWRSKISRALDAIFL